MSRLLFLLIPQALSLLGSSIAQFGIIWSLTIAYSSGKVLLLSSLAAFLPQIGLMVLSGVLSDRRKRKQMIILSDAVSGIVALFLATFSFSGVLPLIMALLIRSACSGLQTPAVDSAVALLSDDNTRERANALRGLLSSAVMLLSPVLAGILLPIAGIRGLMLLDAATAVLAIMFIAFTSIPESSNESKLSLLSGVRYAFGESQIRKLLLFHFIALFLISPGASLTPLLVQRVHEGGEAYLSLSETAYSFGMVIGGMVLSIGKPVKDRKLSIALSLMIYASMLLLIGFTPFFLLYLLMNATIGFVSPRYTALMNSEVQEECSNDMMGRVMSFLAIISSTAIPLGLLIAAPLSDVVDIRIVFICFGLAAMLHSLLFMRRGR